MHQIADAIGDQGETRPSPIEFEMAYQTRVVIDRIKFAIKHMEQFARLCDIRHEVGLQLCNASQSSPLISSR